MKASRKIIITNQEIFEEQPAQFILLPRPNDSMQLSYFMITSNFIYELLKIQHLGSAFYDESVIKEGDFYTCLQIDPVFLIIPRFLEYQNKYIALDEALSGDFSQLFTYLQIEEKAEMICDRKMTEFQQKVYKLNMSKVLVFLSTKYQQALDSVTQNLPEANTFVDHNIKYAIGFMVEYVPSQILQEFLQWKGLPDLTTVLSFQRVEKRNLTESEVKEISNSGKFPVFQKAKKVKADSINTKGIIKLDNFFRKK